jgi:hypothetical protein
MGIKPRRMGEKFREWALGIRWRMEEQKLRRKAGTARWRLRADECSEKSSVHAIVISHHLENLKSNNTKRTSIFVYLLTK